ncbi:hypothetical protein PENTCL1PPCAC_9130, partial [Pristionchus entomophagus]
IERRFRRAERIRGARHRGKGRARGRIERRGISQSELDTCCAPNVGDYSQIGEEPRSQLRVPVHIRVEVVVHDPIAPVGHVQAEYVPASAAGHRCCSSGNVGGGCE